MTDTADQAYSGKAQVVFCRQLGDDWLPLATTPGVVDLYEMITRPAALAESRFEDPELPLDILRAGDIGGKCRCFRRGIF
jgi:hypothetical protein